MVPHTSSYEWILLFLFPAQDFDWKMSCRASYLSGGSGASPSLSSPSLPPPLSTLIGRDSHHMCKGKVMGGMAALISERLPADKANGCGEAWASALLRNKHFHFVWLEWRMERWKWWIDDLRIRGGRGEIDRWNGCGCYSILTDQSEGGEICILSTIYPHLAKEATLRSCDSAAWLLCHVEIQNTYSLQ